MLLALMSLAALGCGLTANVPPQQAANTQVPTQVPASEDSSSPEVEVPQTTSVRVFKQSTDGHWILMIEPIFNASATCDSPTPLDLEEHGSCDAEVERWLLSLYGDESTGAGIAYATSYADAAVFLFLQGGIPSVRIIHAEDVRVDRLRDGEAFCSIADLATLLKTDKHNGAFLFTWDADPELLINCRGQ